MMSSGLDEKVKGQLFCFCLKKDKNLHLLEPLVSLLVLVVGKLW